MTGSPKPVLAPYLNQSQAEKQVNDALERWRRSVVPVEDPREVGDRRARTLTTIAAAIRQGRLEREHVRGRRRWGYLLGAASLVLGLSGVGYYAGVANHQADPHANAQSDSARSQAAATLTGRTGQVWAGTASASELVLGAPLVLGAAQQLNVGERIITEEKAGAGLKVGADTKVQLSERSELLLDKNDAVEKRLALVSGSIDVTVTPETQRGAKTPRKRVVVETPNATVVVHGTRFTVLVDRWRGAVRTTARVNHGIVAVLQNGVERARLSAGESWTSPMSEGQASSSPDSSSLPAVNAAGTHAGAPGEVFKRTGPLSTTSPGGGVSPNSKSSGGIRPSGNKPGSIASGKPGEKLAGAQASEVEPASSTLEQENRLFRLAVDARNHGDDARAVRYFDQLLSKYPKSILIQEARVERFRALRRLGRDRDAAREARRYLIEHGNGFAKDEARDVALTPGKKSP